MSQSLLIIESSINRQEIIEEERIKILKDHAANLIGFLPSGILRESDKEFLNIHGIIQK